MLLETGALGKGCFWNRVPLEMAGLENGRLEEGACGKGALGKECFGKKERMGEQKSFKK